MSINKFQYFSNYDKLRDFKIATLQQYANCSFFEHDINAVSSVSNGFFEDKPITERIITDGNISLEKHNKSSSYLIWENHLLTLENGNSIEFRIDGASFMVVSIKYGDEVHHEIHSIEENRELLERILHLIYNQKGSSARTSSITFKTPSIISLENIVNKQRRKEIINLKTGNSKKK